MTNIHEQWKRNVTIAVEAMSRTCTNTFAARLRAAINLFFAMLVGQYAAALYLWNARLAGELAENYVFFAKDLPNTI